MYVPCHSTYSVIHAEQPSSAVYAGQPVLTIHVEEEQLTVINAEQ